MAYFLVGWSFALPATHAQAWRYAFWIVGAIVYVAQISYEHWMLRSPARLLAWRAGLASAIGGFGLAVAGMLHDLVTRGSVRPLFLVALVAWPLLTGIPAYIGALLAGLVLARVSGDRGDNATAPDRPRGTSPRPPQESVRDALRNGAEIAEFHSRDLSGDYESHFRAACREERNVAALWLNWLVWPNGDKELMAAVLFDRSSPEAVEAFLDRAGRSDGPSLMAAPIEGLRSDEPFYRRMDSAAARETVH